MFVLIAMLIFVVFSTIVEHLARMYPYHGKLIRDIGFRIAIYTYILVMGAYIVVFCINHTQYRLSWIRWLLDSNLPLWLKSILWGWSC